MNKDQKETFVAEFQEKVKAAEAVYLTDFTGLDVKAMTALRSQLRKSGGEFLVVKNRIVMRAFSEMDVPDLSEHLVGPTGVVFGDDDIVEAAKTVADFAKANGDKPVFKVGVVENGLVNAEEIQRLAKLPGREVLLSQVAGALAGPMSALASALGAKLQELSGLIEALQQEKS